MDGDSVPALYGRRIDIVIVNAELLLCLRVVLRLESVLAENNTKSVVFGTESQTIGAQLKSASISIRVGLEIFRRLLIVVVRRP